MPRAEPPSAGDAAAAPTASVAPIGETRGHRGQGPRSVDAHTLGAGRLRATIWTYGATLAALEVPDRSGAMADVLVGPGPLSQHDDPADRAGWPGMTIGRFANRIAGARFSLDGVEHRLTSNERGNHLHGGAIGFDQYVWSGDAAVHGDEASLTLTHHSPSGDEGYPGALAVEVRYRLGPDSLTIEYRAATDAPTPVNLTNHGYWNLAGRGTVAGHTLRVAAAHYVPVDDELIPTGTLAPVVGSRFDFTEPRSLEEIATGGFDHCFVLDDSATPVVELCDPDSGRTLAIQTDQPGLQLYTGDHLDPPHRGLCLETQRLPDSPNIPAFGTSILRPGETYTQRTVHRFGTQREAAGRP